MGEVALILWFIIWCFGLWIGCLIFVFCVVFRWCLVTALLRV